MNQLNFIFEFSLNRNGMIVELENEIQIIEWCLKNRKKVEENILDKLITQSLRKLLCDSKTIITELADDFELPKLAVPYLSIGNDLFVWDSNKAFDKDNWIILEDWLSQNIAYFDRTKEDINNEFSCEVFTSIMNKFKKQEKEKFEPLYQLDDIDFNGEKIQGYRRIDPNDKGQTETIFQLLNKIGYNHLTVYNYIKHYSDKRSAHIDKSTSPMVSILNRDRQDGLNYFEGLAFALLVAIKRNIPEFNSHEIDCLTEENLS